MSSCSRWDLGKFRSFWKGARKRKSNNCTATLAHSFKHTAEGWRCLQVTSVIYCFDPRFLAGRSDPLTSCSLPGEQNLCVRESPAAHLIFVSGSGLWNHLLCCWLVFPCSFIPKASKWTQFKWIWFFFVSFCLKFHLFMAIMQLSFGK